MHGRNWDIKAKQNAANTPQHPEQASPGYRGPSLLEHDLNALAQSHPRLEEILAPYIKARKDRQERSKFLIFAIKSSKPPQLYQLLLRDGADPTVRVEMEQGKTALHFAAETGQTVVARVLLEHQHSLLDIRDRIGRTPLMCAAEGGHEAVVRTLRSTKYGPADVTLRDCKNRSALWYAAYGGNVTIVQMLLDTGKLDPNSADSDGLTPFACAAREGDCEMMRLLLSEGADPDYRAHLGKTPLYLAAGNGREEAVQYLLALSREAAWILTQKLSMGKRRYERQPGEVIRVLSSSSWG